MPRRIVIVEDDAAIRANYAEALRRHGYEVSAYAGRREAMDALRSGKVPRKAGLILDAHGSQYTLTFGAEQLFIGGMQMPEVEEADSPLTLFEERITQLREFVKSFDSLYSAFLQARLSGWDAGKSAIRKWIGDAVRKQAAA